jgi:hypothetical protein
MQQQMQPGYSDTGRPSASGRHPGIQPIQAAAFDPYNHQSRVPPQQQASRTARPNNKNQDLESAIDAITDLVNQMNDGSSAPSSPVAGYPMAGIPPGQPRNMAYGSAPSLAAGKQNRTSRDAHVPPRSPLVSNSSGHMPGLDTMIQSMNNELDDSLGYDPMEQRGMREHRNGSHDRAEYPSSPTSPLSAQPQMQKYAPPQQYSVLPPRAPIPQLPPGAIRLPPKPQQH